MRFTTWAVLVATLLLWSGNWIVARAVRAEISPGVATVGRLIVVLMILLPFAWRGLLKKLPTLTKRDWLVLAGLGLTGGGPHLALQWLGLHYTTAASGILYLSTTPVFILLMTLALGEHIVARQWIGVAISFTGVFLIATHGEPARLSFNIGDLMALASMVLWAAYTVLLRVKRDPLDVIELICMVCIFGAGFMTPWLIAEATTGVTLRLSEHGAIAVLYSAIGSLLLAYVGWSYVVTRLGAARAGVTLHLMPAFGVVLSAIFLSEYPQWFHFVGIALILVGVALSSGVKASSASSSR
ncbi:MAG: DMT family transporter [Betaproteobacteria bacterium]|nr:DMT family transporter [Betaproteobacteria bacterium]